MATRCEDHRRRHRGDADGGRCYRSVTTGLVGCIPAGTHILFIGDSMVRYQYLMLAHALAFGTEFVRTTGPDRLYNEHTFQEPGCSKRHFDHGSWTDFLNKTTRLLNRRGHAVEWCDCYRSNGANHWGRNFERVVENRYFQAGSVQLTYLKAFGRNPVKGLWRPGHPDSERTQRLGFFGCRACSAPGCQACWTYSLERLIRDFVPLLEPTHVFLNIGGLHVPAQHPLHNEEFALWKQAAENVSSRASFFWRTYASRTTNETEYRELVAQHFGEQHTFDAHAVVRGLNASYFLGDRGGHLGAYANNVLNIELIRFLFGRLVCSDMHAHLHSPRQYLEPSGVGIDTLDICAHKRKNATKIALGVQL